MRYKPAVVSGGGGAEGTVGFAGFRGGATTGPDPIIGVEFSQGYDATGLGFFQVHAPHGNADEKASWRKSH